MGVVLWSEEQRLWFRLPQQDERLPTPSGCADVPAAQAARLPGDDARQAGRLAPVRRTSLSVRGARALAEGWWKQARRLL